MSTFFDVSYHLEVRTKLITILKSHSTAEMVKSRIELLEYVCCIYPWMWRRVEKPEGELKKYEDTAFNSILRV